MQNFSVERVQKEKKNQVLVFFILMCLLCASKCLQCWYCSQFLYLYVTDVYLYYKCYLNRNVLHCLYAALKSTAHLVEFLLYSHTADKSNLLLAVSNAKFKLETQILRS